MLWLVRFFLIGRAAGWLLGFFGIAARVAFIVEVERPAAG